MVTGVPGTGSGCLCRPGSRDQSSTCAYSKSFGPKLTLSIHGHVCPDLRQAGFLPKQCSVTPPSRIWIWRAHRSGPAARRRSGRRLDAHWPAPAGHPGARGTGGQVCPTAPFHGSRRPALGRGDPLQFRTDIEFDRTPLLDRRMMHECAGADSRLPAPVP